MPNAFCQRHDITGHERDEAGRMLASLAVMQHALRALVTQVRGSAHNVNSAAVDIAHGNTELSGRTEEAAASLQQTAAAMEQITVRVLQSATTQDQNRDIAQVGSAVARLDQMTQANSALVEESAAASASLHNQAQELSALISRFVLPEPKPLQSQRLYRSSPPEKAVKPYSLALAR